MSTHLLIERADGGISVMVLHPNADPTVELAKWAEHADPSWLPVVRSIAADNPVLPPRRWRKAWRRVATTIGVPLAAARVLRKAELIERGTGVLGRLRDRLEAAEDAGDTVLLSNLRAKRAAIRALANTLDTNLAALSTLAEIDAYSPADLSED
jgi:hypothetical protein